MLFFNKKENIRHSSAAEAHAELFKLGGGGWPDFEGLLRDIYVAIIRRGDTVIDLGCGEGTHLFQMASAAGVEGLAIGVEAAAPVYEKCLEELRKKPNLRRVVELHNVAVSDTIGFDDFVFVPNAPGLSGFKRRPAAFQYAVVEGKVPTLPLDYLFGDRWKSPSFIKMDLSGAEYKALIGATHILASRPIVAFEFNHEYPACYGFGAEELMARFREYEVFDLLGYKYEEPRQFTASQVWNYIAIPVAAPEKIKRSIRLRARDFLLSCSRDHASLAAW